MWMQHQAERAEVRVPYRAVVYICRVVQETEAQRGAIASHTHTQPAVHGRAPIALVENIGAVRTPRQSQIAVDATHGVAQHPPTECQQTPGLITPIACAEQRTQLQSAVHSSPP